MWDLVGCFSGTSHAVAKGRDQGASTLCGIMDLSARGAYRASYRASCFTLSRSPVDVNVWPCVRGVQSISGREPRRITVQGSNCGASAESRVEEQLLLNQASDAAAMTLAPSSPEDEAITGHPPVPFPVRRCRDDLLFCSYPPSATQRPASPSLFCFMKHLTWLCEGPATASHPGTRRGRPRAKRPNLQGSVGGAVERRGAELRPGLPIRPPPHHHE
jgi:hypothetical protein